MMEFGEYLGPDDDELDWEDRAQERRASRLSAVQAAYQRELDRTARSADWVRERTVQDYERYIRDLRRLPLAHWGVREVETVEYVVEILAYPGPRWIERGRSSEPQAAIQLAEATIISEMSPMLPDFTQARIRVERIETLAGWA